MLCIYQIDEDRFHFFVFSFVIVLRNTENKAISLSHKIILPVRSLKKSERRGGYNVNVNVLLSAIDECSINPCVNGECQNGWEKFYCSCHPGYSGTLCDIGTGTSMYRVLL